MTAQSVGQGHALAQLAEHLGELRRLACLTWRQLGQLAHYDHSVLWHAAQGKRLPTAEVTEAFAYACLKVIQRREELALSGSRGGRRETAGVSGSGASSMDVVNVGWKPLWRAAESEVLRGG